MTKHSKSPKGQKGPEGHSTQHPQLWQTPVPACLEHVLGWREEMPAARPSSRPRHLCATQTVSACANPSRVWLLRPVALAPALTLRVSDTGSLFCTVTLCLLVPGAFFSSAAGSHRLRQWSSVSCLCMKSSFCVPFWKYSQAKIWKLNKSSEKKKTIFFFNRFKIKILTKDKSEQMFTGWNSRSSVLQPFSLSLVSSLPTPNLTFAPVPSAWKLAHRTFYSSFIT